MYAASRLLFEQIIEGKKEEIERTEQARQLSLKDTQEAEGAMISRYDTFLEEAQYLAGGQNKRLLEAKAVLTSLEVFLQMDASTSFKVSIGSMVTIESVDTEERKIFLMVFDGAGGGIFSVSPETEEKIYAVSPSSPIGKAIFKYGIGEEIESPVLAGIWEIVEIK